MIGTYRGRSAVALAWRLLGIGAGDEVLVPAYNCGTELDAMLHSGARILGYRVSRNCEIDLEDIFAKKTKRTRAVYIIHYFGWEQPMEHLRTWCDKNGVLLVEDCALALFSNGPSGTIGQAGDAVIFSLSKTLGFRFGGLLSLPASRAIKEPRLAPVGLAPLWKEICHSVRSATFAQLQTLGLYGFVISARDLCRRNRRPLSNLGNNGAYPCMPDDYYFHPETDAERELLPKARVAAGSISYSDIFRRRRGNYLRLVAALAGVEGFEPLYDHLPDGVCPLSLPILVPNRDTCVEVLQGSGIAALPWWAGFHKSGISWAQFPEACWLKRSVLTLPVHQGLDHRQIEYVAEKAGEVLRLTAHAQPRQSRQICTVARAKYNVAHSE